MEERLVFEQKALVLKVNPNYDPGRLRFREWEAFTAGLCGDRTYQAEAIQSAVLYLLSGRYTCTEDLIAENYSRNGELAKRFGTLEEYHRHLQLSGKLYASIDLATGTGKSYVMYGIARIMLGLGAVDKVLVLCPSVTIERELKQKFVQLGGDRRLNDLVPQDAVRANPGIVDGTQTVVAGNICVENIHAVYEGTGSSITDSFRGQGERTLVLNDEVHHVFNKTGGNDTESRNIKKWKAFLLDEAYGFRYILGFTGTAYIENAYFADVIYRYSLRRAIEDHVVKNIEYIQKDDSINENEKFQKIYENHRYNKDKYARVKPLTILVTRDIRSAERLREELTAFLEKTEHQGTDAAEQKVLLVTSHKKHKANVARLRYVDDRSDSIEWIISVSMLTEGWDVKNVFQIVPWEDRAFNSRLLIAQVLGRGLRLPAEYASPQPRVIVFNHDAWSRNIRALVLEILEMEIRIASRVIMEGERDKYHFALYHFRYARREEETQRRQQSDTFDFSRLQQEGIRLESQVLEAEKGSVYETAVGNAGGPREKNYLIQYDSYPVSEVIDRLYAELAVRDWEGRILKLGDEAYTRDRLPPRGEIERIVRMSLERVGIMDGRVTEKNRNRILNAFSTLLRKTGKTVVQTVVTDKPYTISTRDMEQYSYGIGNFRSGSSVFYSSDWETEITDAEQRKILETIIEDDMLPKRAAKEIGVYRFKTPVDLVVTAQKPEMTFVDALCRDKTAEVTTAWVKSRDRNFYAIPYALKYGGRESKTRTYSHKQFSPDFFIRIERGGVAYTIVVETKDDRDVSDMNVAKYKAGKRHFQELNRKLEHAGITDRYLFHFLSPVSYPEFFAYVRDGRLFGGTFRSELEALLEEYDGNEFPQQSGS